MSTKTGQKIFISKPSHGEEEVEAVRKVLESGWTTQGPKVKEFEDKFASLIGSKYAAAVSNCTIGLHTSLMAMGVGIGDGVLTLSHSFIASANCVRHVGADPYFIDIELDTFNISPKALKEFIEEGCEFKNGELRIQKIRNKEGKLITAPKKGQQIKALIVVHQSGMPCNLLEILPIAKKYNLPVLEDCACAMGSQISFDNGKQWEHIGKCFGDLSVFSFHPRKVLSMGEGGIITSNSEQYDKDLRLLRHQGMTLSDLERHKAKSVVVESYDIVGYNFRMTDIQAAIGLVQLDRLPWIIKKRREYDAMYRELLKDLSWLKLPVEPSYARGNWQSYTVTVKPDSPHSRDAIMEHLIKHDIMTKPGVMNAHQEKPYRDVICHLPNSEYARKETFLLPLHPELKPEEIEYVAKTLKAL